MKNKIGVMGSFLILLMAFMVQSCEDNSTDITDLIKKSNRAFTDAVINRDTVSLTNFYTSDAKLFPANSSVVDGKLAIGKFWSETLKMGITKVIFETEMVQKFDDLAIEEGKFMLFVEGDHLVDQGKYLVTWKEEKGQWKVFRDIWNADMAAPVQKASVNDHVLVVLNHIKPPKVKQFEDFVKNYLTPAGVEFFPQAKATVRMLMPTNLDSDGYFTYIFVMDPYVETYEYDILRILSAKYGKTKAMEYLKLYTDCLRNGNSETYMSVQTDW